MAFKRAVRHRAKARICLSGPSGSGKTYSALLLAFGMGKKVAVIDTENNSADLYAELGEYYSDTIAPPFLPRKYVEKIHEAEQAGYDVIIIDSLSPAWASEGGALDQVDKSTSHSGNKWAAWRGVTPQHNSLVDAMLHSPCHIIATVRAKQEYAQSEEGGKKVIKRIGLAPIQRDGLEYEFTLFGEIEIGGHTTRFTKDRTSMFADDIPFKITPSTGKKILEWLNTGVDESKAEVKPVVVQREDKVEECAPPEAATPAADVPKADLNWKKLAIARKETSKAIGIDISDDVLTDFGVARYAKASKTDWTQKEFDLCLAWLRNMYNTKSWVDYQTE